MKKVYFVQVGFEFDGSVYLPYAVGTIIAYCQKYLKNKIDYDFADIIYCREKLADALNKINDPYIAAFSCSVWNMEYNKALAKLIKEKYPECIIIFGGHSVSENASLLKSENYIDYLMFGEGEETFCSFLQNIDCQNAEQTPNIAYRHNAEIIINKRKFNNDISDYPSPYTSGVFDEIIKAHPQTDFLAVLETNRGCPYSCAYCDWCAGKKMRFFSTEKVLGEIDWFSKNKIEYCFCADSNYGMFERDIEIAEALVNAKKKYGYPKVFRPCYEKNSDERVFKICHLLNTEGMDKGATMAYQTLSDKALENIGRKNLTMAHFASLMKKYNEAEIPTYSELILGLPGETKESFCKGICKLLENGQHNSLSVYHCEMLPNSDLSEPDFIKKHKIEVIKVEFNHIHSAIKKGEEVQEYSYLIRSTATMSREDWVYSNLFSVCVQCFHSLGILRCFALYLHCENKKSYFDFYTELLSYILSGDGKLNKLWQSFKEKYENSLSGDWNYYNDKFGNVTWFFEEGAFLEIINDKEYFYEELLPFLKTLDIKDDVFSQLLIYQKRAVRSPFEDESYAEFRYDFTSYFDNIIKGHGEALTQKQTKLLFKNQNGCRDIKNYAKEVVWFGRRRGASMLNSHEIKYL